MYSTNVSSAYRCTFRYKGYERSTNVSSCGDRKNAEYPDDISDPFYYDRSIDNSSRTSWMILFYRNLRTIFSPTSLILFFFFFYGFATNIYKFLRIGKEKVSRFSPFFVLSFRNLHILAIVDAISTTTKENIITFL